MWCLNTCSFKLHPEAQNKESIVFNLSPLSPFRLLLLQEEERKPEHLLKMMKAVAWIGRKKASRPFKDFYEEWIETLKNTLIPLLRRSMLVSSSNLLSTHVQMIHHHFQTYYCALDVAATEDLSQILYPIWRNSLERPFLWFGDFHPNLFTNLLRSFLNIDEEDSTGDFHDGVLENRLPTFPMAWNSPSRTLLSRVEQIECGLRLMVPSFVTRARKSQAGFVDRVATDWLRCGGKQEASKAIGGSVTTQMEELLIVFLDANRLRRSILTEIMGATDVYQASLYLEGLAQFFVGFRDTELVREFEQCKIPLSINH